jgi:uncharacterized protein YjbI with pentapeptide repeats
MRKGQAAIGLALILVALALLLLPPLQTPTGAAVTERGNVGKLETQLVIRPQQIPVPMQTDEHKSLLFPISTYFTDVEGDPIIYQNSLLPSNITMTYIYTVNNTEFKNDSTTIALCHLNTTECEGVTPPPTITLNNATTNTSIDEVPGKFGRGMLVEGAMNLITDPGFEAGVWTATEPDLISVTSTGNSVEGALAMTLTTKKFYTNINNNVTIGPSGSLGVNLTTFNPGAVNNLDFTDCAINASQSTTAAWVVFDSGAPYPMISVNVSTINTPTYGTWQVQYALNEHEATWSTNDDAWANVAGAILGPSWITSKSQTIYWNSVGAHKWWRFKKTDAARAGGCISEVEWYKQAPERATATTTAIAALTPNTDYTLSVYGMTNNANLLPTMNITVDGLNICEPLNIGITLQRYSAKCHTGDPVASPRLNISIISTQPSGPEGNVTIDAIQLELKKTQTPSPYAGAGADKPTLNANIDAKNATIDFWVYPLWNGSDTGAHMLFSDTSGQIVIGKQILGQQKDILAAGYYTGGSWTVLNKFNISGWRANQWHEIRMTLSSRYGSQLYVDGVSTDITTWPALPTSTSPWIIGANTTGGEQADAIFDEIRLYNRALPMPGPVSVNITPLDYYSTKGSNGIPMTFNATDPHDDEYNIQGPTLLVINDVYDPPEPFQGQSECTLPKYSPVCSNEANPIDPSRCTIYNCSVMDRDIMQNTGFTFNISESMRFVDTTHNQLEWSLDYDEPTNGAANWNINISQIVALGNLTFSPIPNYHGHQYFKLRSRDPITGNSNTTNRFLINVLPGPTGTFEHHTPTGNVGNPPWYEWTQNTKLNVSLVYFYNTTGNTLLYGFNNLNETSLTVTVDAITGNLTITPLKNFTGTASVNFSATDVTSGIYFSDKVLLRVTPELWNITQYNNIGLLNLFEDSNISINMSNYFNIPNWTTNLRFYWEPINRGILSQETRYPNVTMWCGMESTTCQTGGAPMADSLGIITTGRMGSGLNVNIGFERYNVTFNESRGTIGFWFAPTSNVSGMNGSNMTVNTSVLFDIGDSNERLTLRLLNDFNTTLVATLYSATTLSTWNAQAPNFVNWNAGQWTHIAVVWNTTTAPANTYLYLYLNGTLVSTSTAGPVIASTPRWTNITFASNITGGENISGTFDEVQAYNYAKSPAAIVVDSNYTFPFLTTSILDNNVTFSPQHDYYGANEFKLYVTDVTHGSSALSNIFTVNVNAVNDPPYPTNLIPNQSWNEDTTLNNAFNLYDHFYDVDNRTLVFNMVNNTRINATIGPEGYVNFSSQPNWYGTEKVRFNASDGMNMTWSNEVWLIVQAVPDILAVVTPPSPSNGTIPIVFYVTDSTLGYVNVTASFSKDGGATFENATGPSMANISVFNVTDNFGPLHDARLSSQYQTINYGEEQTIQVGTDATIKQRSTLLFQMPLAEAVMIHRATLKLYQVAAFGESRAIGIYMLNNTWNESAITYRNAPGTNGTGPLSGRIIDSVSEYKEWDVTNAVKNWLNGSAENFGLLVKDMYEPNSLGLHTFASSEYNGNVTPKIEIEYEGTPHMFPWDSIADLNYTNQDHVVIRMTVYANTSGMTRNFTVQNNHAPLVNSTAQLAYTMFDNENVTIDALSNIFYDIDNQTLTISSIYNESQLNVTPETDLRGPVLTIADGVGFQGVPDLAIMSNNERLAVWEDSEGISFGIQYRRFGTDGSTIRTGTVAPNSHDHKQPRVAALNDGSAMVWREDRGDSDIVLGVMDSNDSVVKLINVTNTSVRQTQPDLATFGNTIAVTWIDETSGTGEVYLAAFLANGSRLMANTPVSYDGVNTSRPEIAITPGTNNITIVWTRDGRLVQMRRYNNTFNATTATMNVSNLSTYASDASVISTKNSTYVTWADDLLVFNKSMILVASVNNTNTVTHTLLFNDSFKRFNPSIGIDSTLNKYVVYERGVDRASDMVYAKLNASDFLLAESKITNDSIQQINPVIAVDSTDRKTIVWQARNVTDDIFTIDLSAPTGRLFVAAARNYSGNTSINVSAFDGYNSTTVRINFSILFFNDPPEIGDIHLLVDEDSVNNTFNMTPYGQDEETPAAMLRWSVGSAANLALIMRNHTNLSVTPTANYSGNVSVQFTLTDGEKATSTTGIIEVVTMPDPPVQTTPIPNMTWAANNDKQFNISQYFIDIDGMPLTFTNNTAAINITFSFFEDGTVNMTPQPGWVGRTNVVFNASNGYNSTLSNTVSLGVTRPSNLTNTYVDATLYNGMYTNIAGLDGANMTDCTVTGSIIVTTRCLRSTIKTCNITDGKINDSTLEKSNLRNCTIINSTTKSYSAENCVQVNAILDPNVIFNATGSTIINSTILFANVTRSNVTNVSIIWSDVDNSSIFNASFEDTQVYNAVISNYVLIRGQLIFNTTLYDADIEGPMNLTNLTNYAPHASFTYVNAGVGSNTTLNASSTTDPNLPQGAGYPLHEHLTYNWTFGDGQGVSTLDNSAQHNYTAQGTYTARLLVIDAYGKNSTATATYTIGTAPPSGGSSNTGGGGGGGGGGRSSDECTPSSQCGPWSDCTSGRKSRDCVVITDCDNSSKRPLTDDICIPVVHASCDDGIRNQDETGIDCGGSCAQCPILERPSQPAVGQPGQPQPEAPTPEAPATPPTLESIAKGPEAGIIAILVGVLLILTVAVAVVMRGVNLEVADAARYVLRSLKAGKTEDEIRKKLLENKWHTNIIDKAINLARLQQALEFAEERMNAGAKDNEVMADLKKAGWSKGDINKVMKQLKKK